MGTEYRRGIPGTAHVEAAKRLGLLWHRESHPSDTRTKFALVYGVVESNWSDRINLESWTYRLNSDENSHSYRPIRPDGTPVDWETLDAEVSRVAAQPQGFRAGLWRRICRHFIGADEDRVSSRHLSDVETVERRGCLFRDGDGWQWLEDEGPTRTDILGRWIVYQELKPLYDLVDGAQGEAAMPRDVYNECRARAGWTGEADDRWLLRYNSRLEAVGIGEVWHGDGYTLFERANMRNFAAVLDAVAERRVAERMRALRAPTVTSAQPPVPIGTVMVQDADGTVRPARMNDTARVIGLAGIDMPAAVRPAAQPEPRRFADVRPDRHGWRWWRLFGSDCGALGTPIEANPVHGWRVKDDPDADWHLLGHYNSAVDGIRTVIPTDEQGNPVSWGAIAPAGTVQSVNSDAATENEVQRVTQAVSRVVQQASQQILGSPVTVSPTGQVEPTNALDEQSAIPSFSRGRYTISPGQFSNDFTASAPITAESFARVLIQLDRGQNSVNAAQLHTDTIRYCEQQISQAVIGVDMPAPDPRQELPRFTTDELDDVDHSKTTKLDEITLRRGKLPTVEQIAKYREVRARRTGGAVADALKESRIDCEVAQYVLERWAGGLGDAQVPWLIATAEGTGRLPDSYASNVIDERVQNELRKRDTLDTSEKPSPTVQRERQEAEERRQRLARLSEQLRTERVANVTTNEAEPNRFDLLEPDPTVDPAASIRAWEARRAAMAAASRKVGQEARQPVTQPKRVEKPPAPKPRPAILVVDAEKDGLTWGEAGLALLGLKLNEAC